MSTNGRIVLPAELRRRDLLSAGQEIDVERIGQGEYRLTCAAKPRNRGLVTLLLACPVKGWFKPVPPRGGGGAEERPLSPGLGSV